MFRYNTLNDLVSNNEKPKNHINIDFFIEIPNKYVINSNLYNFNNSKIQLSEVINKFINCIKTKECPYLRVHWTDPTLISEKVKRYEKLPN